MLHLVRSCLGKCRGCRQLLSGSVVFSVPAAQVALRLELIEPRHGAADADGRFLIDRGKYAERSSPPAEHDSRSLHSQAPVHCGPSWQGGLPRFTVKGQICLPPPVLRSVFFKKMHGEERNILRRPGAAASDAHKVLPENSLHERAFPDLLFKNTVGCRENRTSTLNAWSRRPQYSRSVKKKLLFLDRQGPALHLIQKHVPRRAFDLTDLSARPHR